MGKKKEMLCNVRQSQITKQIFQNAKFNWKLKLNFKQAQAELCGGLRGARGVALCGADK